MLVISSLKLASQIAFLLRSQWWDDERIAAYQERKLTRMMRHAVSAIPFYQALGIRPESIVSSGDLSRFPYLTKSLLQEHASEFLDPRFTARRLHASRTSGSSGEPTTTYFDHGAWLFSKYAIKARRVIATASPLGKRLLIVADKPLPAPKSRNLAGLVQIRRKSMLDPMAEHAELIRTFRPHMIYAFPSFMLELLDFVRGRGQDVPPIPVIMTSSELLTPGARRQIETAFASHVYDVYGSTEFKEIAWQCREGSYHLNFESVFVETRAQNLVVSDLRNVAMPLLRYDLGDQGLVEPGGCSCGRRSPRLQAMTGRESEMLLLPDGARIFPYALTLTIEQVPGIRRYQIVHVAPAEVRLDVVPAGAEPSEAVLAELCRRLEALLDRRIHVIARRVDGIPRASGGKRKVFVREFGDGAPG